MKKQYIYQWLDDLVADLNPSISKTKTISDEEAEEYIGRITDEKHRVQNKLKEIAFSIDKTDVEKSVVRKYHDALVVLVNKTYEHLQHPMAENPNLVRVLENLLNEEHNVLRFFQTQYPHFFGSEERMPITLLVKLKDELLSKMDLLKERLAIGGNGPETQAIVLKAWEKFIHKIDQKEFITVHEANYHLYIMRDVENNTGKKTYLSGCPSLHELLVYWNLNSKECIDYFTEGFDSILEQIPNIAGKIDFIHLQFKNVTQMPHIPNFTYDTRYPGIKDYFIDYMSNELEYLEKKKTGFVPLDAEDPAPAIPGTPSKIICHLSIDQISLFFRALDEKRYITARSLSAVYQAIAPHISTTGKENLSWKSMRTKAYAAEQRDKDILIEVLEQVKEYLKHYPTATAIHEIYNSLKPYVLAYAKKDRSTELTKSQDDHQQDQDIAELTETIDQVIKTIQSY